MLKWSVTFAMQVSMHTTWPSTTRAKSSITKKVSHASGPSKVKRKTHLRQDDLHIPTLTVAQTLNFALSLKTPGRNGRIPGMTRKEFDESIRNTLLQMLNISHTANTYVGDAFVRGVSGGERKRVSIAEMMATRAHVLCFDNSTRGLDASTALDFVKALRVMTDVLGQTTFATLYVPSVSSLTVPPNYSTQLPSRRGHL